MFTYPNIIINKNSKWRNGFGCQRGPFSLYKALSIATNKMSEDHFPDLEDTEPVFNPKPNKNWEKITSFHPYGHSQVSSYSYVEPHDNKTNYLKLKSEDTLLSQDLENTKPRETIPIEPTIAVVNESLCRGCGLCTTICEFHAPEVIEISPEKYIAKINEALCKGCGTCVSWCPPGAITAKHFTDKQIYSMIDTAYSE